MEFLNNSSFLIFSLPCSVVFIPSVVEKISFFVVSSVVVASITASPAIIRRATRNIEPSVIFDLKMTLKR